MLGPEAFPQQELTDFTLTVEPTPMEAIDNIAFFRYAFKASTKNLTFAVIALLLVSSGKPREFSLMVASVSPCCGELLVRFGNYSECKTCKRAYDGPVEDTSREIFFWCDARLEASQHADDLYEKWLLANRTDVLQACFESSLITDQLLTQLRPLLLTFPAFKNLQVVKDHLPDNLPEA